MPQPSPTGQSASLSILVAEDEAIARLVLVRMLELAGHRVTAVSDGDQAMDCLTSQSFDLALIDNQMPGTDGLGVCRALQDGRIGQRPALGVILLTANLQTLDRNDLPSLGIAAALEKPLSLDLLNEQIERLRAANSIASEPAKAGQPVATTPIFNPDAITVMLEYLSADRVAELFGKTILAIQAHGTSLSEVWAQGDLKSCAALAHKIAGIAVLYGGVALHAHARALELALELGDNASAGLEFDRISPILRATLERLTAEQARLSAGPPLPLP